MGNISYSILPSVAVAVHPHVCGEHCTFSGSCVTSSGSSPRVWGTCDQRRRMGGGWRFIPTCVGNINGTTARLSAMTVHPHVCGEHAAQSPLQPRSPPVHPHVCGEHAEAEQQYELGGRFIPTCVGNIMSMAWTEFRSAVHPHVCGEHGDHCWRAFAAGGSSPRVWGTWGYKPFTPRRTRFIPTCVGNINSTARPGFFIAVHPHVCGEHLFAVDLRASRRGSSPRVWGT